MSLLPCVLCCAVLGYVCREGNLIWPVLLDNVTPDMRIAWEEPFGPVLPIMRVPDVDAAVQHCNSSNFGLQGCVFTRDINNAMRISDAMQTGTVQVSLRMCVDNIYHTRVKLGQQVQVDAQGSKHAGKVGRGQHVMDVLIVWGLAWGCVCLAWGGLAWLAGMRLA
jgi:delta 1-pyrroline-5-carboxylate dehydrogenase